jgi:hypothetical protein
MKTMCENLVQIWREMEPSQRNAVQLQAQPLATALQELDTAYSGVEEPDLQANEEWHRKNNPEAPFLNKE